jgi:hypothetical protein
MGMRVGSSGAAWASQSSPVGNWQQRQQSVNLLKSALKSGDLAGAQQAFAAITANNPNATSNTNSPLAQIGQALQAGDMAGAQQAAQSWRASHQGGPAGQAAGAANLSTAAVDSFLKTLSPLTATTSNSASSAAAATPTASDQVGQALAASEKNLFDSLQAVGTTTGTSTTASTPSSTAAATTQVAATALDASAAGGASPVASTHHHHHHSGGGDGAVQAELSALIGQTSQAASATTSASASTTDAASATSATTAASTGLDQSFNNLLTSLGVSGTSASLNKFLTAMQSSMPGPVTGSQFSQTA